MKSRRQILLQTGLLTVAFAGTYFALRALPGEDCVFLHYELRTNPDGSQEFCGLDEARFVDLSQVSFPVRAGIDFAREELRPGEPVEATLYLQGPGEIPLGPEQLAVIHEEKLHLLVIDPALGDYHHIHPVPEGESGRWHFSFAPRAGGEYRFYAEVVPLRTQRKLVAEIRQPVAGTAAAAVPDRPLSTMVEGYAFELVTVEEPRVGKQSDLILRVRDPGGKVIAFEELMGAYAHLVAFDAEGRGYAHMHPLADGEGVGSAEAAFPFALRVDRPGQYRVWAQVKIDGREVFAPFDLVL